VTNIALEDSDDTLIRRKWHKNYGFIKAMIVSNLNLAIAVVEAKKVGARVAAKRARDKEDSDVEVLGVKKAAINK
jgi:hypothetical protein